MHVERLVGASKSREVVIWSIVFLSNHTVISGDSAGKVQMWDGITGTLVHTHLVTKWDVLALSVSQASKAFQTHIFKWSIIFVKITHNTCAKYISTYCVVRDWGVKFPKAEFQKNKMVEIQNE